jgi:hypothetical protein
VGVDHESLGCDEARELADALPEAAVELDRQAKRTVKKSS